MSLSLAPAKPVIIAAFDFDGTVTRRDTLMPYLAFGLGWPRFMLALLRCSPWLAGFALRLVRNDTAKQKLLLVTLGGKTAAEVQGWTSRWLAHDFDARLNAWTLQRLAWHQERGHCCVMVSASPDIYLHEVARRLGFDGLVCTEMQTQDGRLTGLTQTPNCHGEQKVLRLKAWMVERFGGDAPLLYAYGDTAGDLPMLRLASQAWYRGVPWGGI